METLYVKTDGPVPQGMSFPVGVVLEVRVEDWMILDSGRYAGFDYKYAGSWHHMNIKMLCEDGAILTFCDSTGTPVPAPWESKDCSVCGGDGKETCSNPDHGFIYAMPGEISRLGCPVCAGSPGFKVPNGGDCEHCQGSGKESAPRGSEKCAGPHCSRPATDNHSVECLADAARIQGWYPQLQAWVDAMQNGAPIDYRAHAERLAEALEQVRSNIGFAAVLPNDGMVSRSQRKRLLNDSRLLCNAALSAYNQAKG